ncbi:MAG: TIM barrel protein [Chloroflexi bacterium]|nr:TIM barrel protein [Chloroflexota bacterium]
MPETGGLLFGPAGIPLSAKGGTTQDGIERVAELGLGCLEIEFVQGVRMGTQTAKEVGQAAQEHGVALSAHAPYYINLNAHEPEKLLASQERILQTARIGALCGAGNITFHPAFYLGDPPSMVLDKVKVALAEVVAALRAEGNKVRLRPEVMGKPSQFGTIDELLELSAGLDGVEPTYDVSHWHARTGAFNTYGEFLAFFRKVEDKLGRKAALEHVLLHVSGIDYGMKGERKHLVLANADFNYRDLLRALRDLRVQGLIICESPNLEEDALLLKQTYQEMGLT